MHSSCSILRVPRRCAFAAASLLLTSLHLLAAATPAISQGSSTAIATSAAATTATSSAVAAHDALLARFIDTLRFGELVSLDRPTKSDGAVALGLLGDERAVPVLFEHLRQEKNDQLRLHLTRALSWIGGPTVVPALEAALQDKYPYVRHRAANALKAITGREYEYDKTGLPARRPLMESIAPTPDSR